MKEINLPKRNIKVDLRTWNSLKNLKKPNETFNDVVLDLLKERTQSVEGKNVKAIKYNRKTRFLETYYKHKTLGVEFEYNDSKGEQADFCLDLKIRKVFFGKKIINPSVFFGVDSARKHFNPVYLNIYLQCVSLVLAREFRVDTRMHHFGDFENIVCWRKVYYDYSLSEDSFISDIEEPLRLSEEEKPNKKIKEAMEKSP